MLIGGEMIRLVLADDHQVFAEGLGMVLDNEDDVEVLGIAPDGEGALRLVTEHLPDVLLLDAHMPRTDVCEVVRAAKAAAPDTMVVVLSADTRREIVDVAIQAGADGFLAKDLTGWQVASVLRKLLAGQTAPVTPAMPERPARDPSVELRVRTLSAREREILGLLVNGHSNRRIAEECFLSLNTVRTHVQNVLVKLGVHSKLEAVAFALENQVVPGRANWASAWDDGGQAV
jgi:DNA-binding NarL/FixJ family response regulator